MVKHGSLIPSFIESSSPKGLRRLMFETNLKNQSKHHYFDIQSYVNSRGKTRWIAWYYVNIKDEGIDLLIDKE